MMSFITETIQNKYFLLLRFCFISGNVLNALNGSVLILRLNFKLKCMFSLMWLLGHPNDYIQQVVRSSRLRFSKGVSVDNAEPDIGSSEWPREPMQLPRNICPPPKKKISQKQPSEYNRGSMGFWTSWILVWILVEVLFFCSFILIRDSASKSAPIF